MLRYTAGETSRSRWTELCLRPRALSQHVPTAVEARVAVEEGNEVCHHGWCIVLLQIGVGVDGLQKQMRQHVQQTNMSSCDSGSRVLQHCSEQRIIVSTVVRPPTSPPLHAIAS